MEFECVILESETEDLGELRIYPTYVGVWFKGQVVAGQGKLEDLYNYISFGFEWDGLGVRILGVNEGIHVLLTFPQNLLKEKAIKILLKGNKKVLIKKLKAFFAANPESSGGFRRLDARKRLS